MSLNLKVLTLAALAAGSTIAAAPATVAAQNPHSQSGRGKMDKGQGHDDKSKDKAGKRDDHGAPNVVLSQAQREARARQAREQANRNQVSKGKNGNGPAFCRSGAGHPVQGRAWCVQKGFGLGNDRWGNAGWGNVPLGGRASSRTGTATGGVLSDILGRVIYGRLQTQANNFGGGPLTGRWVSNSGGPLLLQVQAGGRPLAEFVDGNRDGRAEVVMLNLGR
jgi:hypothetical protein